MWETSDNPPLVSSGKHGNVVELHSRKMFDFYPIGEMCVCVSVITISQYIDMQVNRINTGIE